MLIVYGDDIVRWTVERMPCQIGFDKPFGMGFIKNNVLVGSVVYDNYRPQAKSICFSGALDDKNALTRGTIRHVFDYPFNQLGVNRITAMIDVNNDSSIRLARQLGFTHEGTLRQGSPVNCGDLLVFGMLKGECNWLLNRSKKL